MPKISSVNIRRGTTAEWTAANPVLSNGEVTWDSTVERFKVGNGVSTWSAIIYEGNAALAGKANTSHTHNTSDINAGTLADARLPARIGTVSATITDWNTTITTGWYLSTASTTSNAPDTTNNWLGMVENSGSYMTQTVHAYVVDGSSDTKSYRRSRDNTGAWSAWYKLMLSQAESDVRYLQVTQRAAVNGVASLDAAGKVPTAQLPASQVGTSLMGTYAQRPSATTTAAGTIYYATDTMESYRCSGTAWAVIAAGSELGSAELRTIVNTLNTNGSWIDVPGMAVTFIAPERPIKVELTADVCVTVGNTNAQLRLLINNTVSMTELSAWQPYAYKWDTRSTKVRWTGLVTGNPHTVKLQAKGDTGADIWIDGSSTKTSILTVSGV